MMIMMMTTTTIKMMIMMIQRSNLVHTNFYLELMGRPTQAFSFENTRWAKAGPCRIK